MFMMCEADIYLKIERFTKKHKPREVTKIEAQGSCFQPQPKKYSIYIRRTATKPIAPLTSNTFNKLHNSTIKK